MTRGPALAAVTACHELPDWPKGTAAPDLGGRVPDVVPGPGRKAAATVFHDQRTGLPRGPGSGGRPVSPGSGR